MNEAHDPVLPGQEPGVVDQHKVNEYLSGATLGPIDLGGNKAGGRAVIHISELGSITHNTHSFMLNNEASDLLVLIRAGHQQLGIVDTEPEEPKKNIPLSLNRLALAVIEGDPIDDGNNIKIGRDPNGKQRYVWLSEPDTSAVIGREKSSVHFDEVFGLSGDEALDSKHLTFRFTEEGELVVIDNNSNSGTTLLINRQNHIEGQPADAEGQHEMMENELGEAAVEKVVEKPDLDISRDSIPRRSQALKELTEAWGLNDKSSAENAEQFLEATLYQVDEMLTTFIELESMYGPLRSGLEASRNDHANRLSPGIRDMTNNLISSKGFIRLINMDEHNVLLPRNTRSTLIDAQRKAQLFKQKYNEMTELGPNYLNIEDTDVAIGTLDQLHPITRTLLYARQELEEMKMRLSGFHNDLMERTEGKIKYRNEQVDQWAERLQGKELSKSDLEKIRLEMEQAVRREAEMIGDPNSPSRYFDLGIRENMGKSRQGAYASGRPGGEIGSQKYVSEVMLDMLSGKFDIAGADDILLNPKIDGGIEYGQHRSAALAMIYGANEWVDIAKQLGYKINKK